MKHCSRDYYRNFRQGGGTGMRAICIICYDVASHDILLGEECSSHYKESEYNICTYLVYTK